MTGTDYSNYNARALGTYEKIWQSTGKCVFCDLRDKYIITELNGVVLTMNLFPYTLGHLLIIPRRHFESFEETSEIEWQTIHKLTNIGIELLKETFDLENIWFMFRTPKGYSAGKSVAHSHAHLVPYYDGFLKFHYETVSEAPLISAEKLRKNLSKI